MTDEEWELEIKCLRHEIQQLRYRKDLNHWRTKKMSEGKTTDELTDELVEYMIDNFEEHCITNETWVDSVKRIGTELAQLRKENERLKEDLKALRTFGKPDLQMGWCHLWQEEIYKIIQRTKILEDK